MNIAVSADENSNLRVFDFTSGLIVYKCLDGKVLSREKMFIEDDFPSLRAARLKKLNIDTLICENLSNTLAAIIWHMNINVISGVSDSPDVSVRKLLAGDLADAATRRPCFCAKRWRGGGRRRGGKRRRHRNI